MLFLHWIYCKRLMDLGLSDPFCSLQLEHLPRRTKLKMFTWGKFLDDYTKCFKTSSSSKVFHILSPSSFSSSLVSWSSGDEEHDALPLTSKALFSLSFCFCLTMVPLFFFSFLFFDESLFRSWFPLGRTDPFLFVCWTFPLRFLFVKKKSHFCSKHKCIFF